MPMIVLLQDVGDTDGCADEKRWIATLRFAECPLTNGTDGGDGTLGYKYDRGVVDAIAAQNRAHWQNPAYREHQRNIRLGVRLSDETKRKMSVAHTGQKRTTEVKMHMSESRKQYWEGRPHPSAALNAEQVLDIFKRVQLGSWGIVSQLSRE